MEMNRVSGSLSSHAIGILVLTKYSIHLQASNIRYKAFLTLIKVLESVMNIQCLQWVASCVIHI